MRKPVVRLASAALPRPAARKLSTAAGELPTASEPAAEEERGHGRDYGWLMGRLWATKPSDGESMERTLRRAAESGDPPSKTMLVSCIKQFRKHGRVLHALQVSEWMVSSGMSMESGDHAVHLDLLARAKGISAAEDHFERLPADAKDFKTYVRLLSCYCNQLAEEKALALLGKMNEMGLARSAWPFTCLMKMYLNLGRPEKAIRMVKEMKRKHVFFNLYTYNIWMKSLGNLNDIDGVERVLVKMKDRDWTTYSSLAQIYIKAGQFEKAELTLKKLEAQMDPTNREPYHYLIGFYAATSNLTEVHRVWKLLQSRFQMTHNVSYLFLIPALSKLNDMDGVGRCFQAWESSFCEYDNRIVYATITAYLDHDMYDEAVSVFEIAKMKLKHPPKGMERKHKQKLVRAPEMFIHFLLKSGRVDSALKHLKAAISESEEEQLCFQLNQKTVHAVLLKSGGVDSVPEHLEAAISESRDEPPKFQLKQQIVDAFFKCFEEGKDAGGAEEFCKMLKTSELINSDAYHQLLKVYAASSAGVDTEIRKRVEEYRNEPRPDVEKLLDEVCPK